MTSNLSKRVGIGGVSLLALLFLIIFFPLSTLTFAINDTLYWSSEKEFSLQWIHSVEKEAWLENYEVEEETLLLTTTKFKTFGAGVPSTPEEGTKTTRENGFVTMQINRSFHSLELVVSENVKSTLHIEKEEIPLYKWTGDYESITIAVQKMSLWDRYLKGEHL